jgi:alpha-tubulin suppressor-like RCC1 family protein
VGCVGSCWPVLQVNDVLQASHASVVVAGDGELGQLGHGGREHVPTPRLLPVSEAPGTRVSALACGSLHTLLLGSDDVVYACGHSLYGQVRA